MRKGSVLMGLHKAVRQSLLTVQGSHCVQGRRIHEYNVRAIRMPGDWRSTGNKLEKLCSVGLVK